MNEITEKLLSELMKGTKKIKDLDPKRATNRQAVFAFVEQQPSKLATLVEGNEITFLKFCIEKKPSLFIYLNREQYTEDLAKIFVYSKLTEGNKEFNGFCQKAFDENILLTLAYKTCDGEQLFYFDPELEISTYLIVKLGVSFKITNSIEFLKNMDLSVTMFGYNAVRKELLRLINSAYRTTVKKYVDEGKLSVYKLNGLCGEMEDDFTVNLDDILAGSGVIVQKVTISNLSVSKQTEKILEQNSLELVNMKKKKKAEIEYEKESLLTYEKKAEIHAKHPNFPVAMTEAEKDFAIERYATRYEIEHGRHKQEDYTSELNERRAKRVDAETVKQADVPVREEVKVSKYGLLIIPFIILFIIGIVMASESGIGLGLLFIGLSIIPLGFMIAISVSKKEKGEENETNKEADAEYQAQIEEYQDTAKKG